MLEMTIIGNVGQDAQNRAKRDGSNFVNFSVGVSTSKDKTEWINVICSQKQEQAALNYIKKGMKILVRGYPTINCYTDKTNKLVTSFTVSCHMFEFLSSSKNNQTDNQAGQEHVTESANTEPDDYMPF